MRHKRQIEFVTELYIWRWFYVRSITSSTLLGKINNKNYRNIWLRRRYIIFRRLTKWISLDDDKKLWQTKYLGMTVTNRRYIHENILNSIAERKVDQTWSWLLASIYYRGQEWVELYLPSLTRPYNLVFNTYQGQLYLFNFYKFW